MVRTIIKGGTVVNSEGTLRADLIIEGEKVTGVAAQAESHADDTVIDASGLLVLPGIVDAHTHIQLDTGVHQTADNWEIGTKAAAAGGVTTVIDFANQLKGKPFSEALAARQAEAADAIIDYAFHMVILEPAWEREQLTTDLQDLLELGIHQHQSCLPPIAQITMLMTPHFCTFAEAYAGSGMIAMVHCRERQHRN